MAFCLTPLLSHGHSAYQKAQNTWIYLFGHNMQIFLTMCALFRYIGSKWWLTSSRMFFVFSVCIFVCESVCRSGWICVLPSCLSCSDRRLIIWRVNGGWNHCEVTSSVKSNWKWKSEKNNNNFKSPKLDISVRVLRVCHT